MQAALGSIVVLATSTLNRVMVVELALPAILPGALVALHYGVQVLRPRMGYGSDMGGRRTPWIVGGMAALAIGGVGAAGGVALMASSFLPGLLLAIAAFIVVGLGVGAAGTSLLTLMAARTDARRPRPGRHHPVADDDPRQSSSPRPPPACCWTHSAPRASSPSPPASPPWRSWSPLSRFGAWSLRQKRATRPPLAAYPPLPPAPLPHGERERFSSALREIWDEPHSRRFAIFVFVSMLAYSAQEVVLEPFAGAVFHLTPGQTAGLTGLQHAGVLAGMACVAVACLFAGEFRQRAMRAWTVGGCIASTLAMAGMAAAALVGAGLAAAFFGAAASGPPTVPSQSRPSAP